MSVGGRKSEAGEAGQMSPSQKDHMSHFWNSHGYFLKHTKKQHGLCMRTCSVPTNPKIIQVFELYRQIKNTNSSRLMCK